MNKFFLCAKYFISLIETQGLYLNVKHYISVSIFLALTSYTYWLNVFETNTGIVTS